MAHLLGPQSQQDKDKEQQAQAQAPTLGGGGIAPSPMTQGAQRAAPAAAPASPMEQSASQGKGSNFTNLSSFLTPTVAAQNQAKVQTLGTQLQGAEQQAFDKAADPLRKAEFTPIQGNARDLVDKLVPTPEQKVVTPQNAARKQIGVGSPQDAARKTMPAPVDQGNPTFQQLQSMLTQDYTGPMSVDYTKGADGKRLDLLGNADTTANALSPGSFDANNMPNSQGNNWLDQAMLKSDQGTMGNIAAAKTGAEAQGKTFADEVTKLGDKATGLKDAAAKARDTARGDLKSYGDEMLAGINQKVKDKTAAEDSDRAGKVLRDPTTGAVVNPGVNQEMTDNWEAGTGANAGNVSTAEERGRLGNIASLLGMDDMKVDPTGQYVSGRYTTKTVPGALQPTAVSEEMATMQAGIGAPFNLNSPTGIQDMLADPARYAKRKKYEEYRAKGYPVDEAIKLATSDNNLTVKPVRA